MNLYDVMTEVDVRLKTVPGLRVAEIGYAGSVQPPAAVQYPPVRLNFDQTYRRGGDSYEDHVVVVFVGKSNLRSALKAIAPYLDGSGVKSIKAKLDASDTAPYTSCADLTVGWAELDAGARMGGSEYLAALFHCTITGVGA